MKPIAQTSASGNWKKEPLSPSQQKEVNDKGQIGNQRLRKQEIGKTAGARAGSPKKADTIGTLLAGLMRGKRRENTVEEPRNERGPFRPHRQQKETRGTPGTALRPGATAYAKRSRPETPAASASQRRRRRSLQASAAE